MFALSHEAGTPALNYRFSPPKSSPVILQQTASPFLLPWTFAMLEGSVAGPHPILSTSKNFFSLTQDPGFSESARLFFF
ncbi:hypothetical protein [uncultured Mailhella sp.]|uniref:hypothetical protein n=1 Tax=uncultured Mailhella sp. TaxID=1981031 RepID=UPI0025DECFCF|nr:hypothetical protein [uncultured Mailhella sp.]